MGRGKRQVLAAVDGSRRLMRRQRRHGIVLLAAAEERPQPAQLGHPRPVASRDRALDRSPLPPPPTPTPTRKVDPIEYEAIMNRTANLAA